MLQRQFGAEGKDLASRIEKIPYALSARQLYSLLNISKTTLYDMISRRTIPCFRFESLIRFDPARIAAWMREREIGALESRNVQRYEERRAA